MSSNNQLNNYLNLNNKNIESSLDNNSPLSPVTLAYLNDEIKDNETSLANPNLDNETIEKLMDDRRYLLDQRSNHLNAILEIAKKTPVNDIDTDYLLHTINY